MPTQTAAGNCYHRVSKSPSVPGTRVVFVSAACSPFLLFVVNYSNERLLCGAVQQSMQGFPKAMLVLPVLFMPKALFSQ